MLQVVNQPYNGQLGTILSDKLSDIHYNEFIILSAFAKNSGVLRIKHYLQEFKHHGGSIDAFIGIDANGTSYEALCNLFSLVDNLYIVHDNDPRVTFHSKVYYLSSLDKKKWMAIGSNNLTGGGLWTNYESAAIIEDPSGSGSYNSSYKAVLDLVDYYKANPNNICLRIDNESMLLDLLNKGLLRHEIQLQIEAGKSRRASSGRGKNADPGLFGTHGSVHIPRIEKTKNKETGEKAPAKIIDGTRQVVPVAPVVPSNDSEKMWFETRAMTGGSRNILDLSMLGSLIQGSGKGTRYETDNDSIVLGSVAFFDIDPSAVTVEKDITINYSAKDYVGCTIKMHHSGRNPNGSWRIQLKGITSDGERLTTAEGVNWFVQKIIVLEKIKTDYYVMSVISDSELANMCSQSTFVARNGSGANSKMYGLLDI